MLIRAPINKGGVSLSPTPKLPSLALPFPVDSPLFAALANVPVEEMGERKDDANGHDFDQVFPETSEYRFEHHSILRFRKITHGPGKSKSG